MVLVKLKKIVRCGAMAALLALSMVVVAGCQQQHAVEDPDTKLMQDAVDSGKEPVNSIDTPFYVLIVGTTRVRVPRRHPARCTRTARDAPTP